MKLTEVLNADEDGLMAPAPEKPRRNYSLISMVVIPVILVLATAGSLLLSAPVSDTAIAANSRGVEYNSEGDYENALVSFTRAIELDPDFALAYANRGWVYIKLEQYENCVADCTRAIELDPDLAPAYNNRGWAYTELGKYKEAIDDYNRAIELDPGLAE